MHPGRPLQSAQIRWQGNIPYNVQFEDPYFSPSDGPGETQYVFLQQNALPQRWQTSQYFRIGELGFGTGLNFLVTAECWKEYRKPNAWLEYFSFELFPLSKDDFIKALSNYPAYQTWHEVLLSHYPSPIEGHYIFEWPALHIRLHLLLGDGNQCIETLVDPIDCWYLDGFDPRRNQGLWNESLFQKIARACAEQATFSTYSASSQVRRLLQQIGFQVEKAKGFATKREMLKGSFPGKNTLEQTKPWFRYSKPSTASLSNRSVTLIGAGIAGLTVANRFAAYGWQVKLIDQSLKMAQGASGNRAALLYPTLSASASQESQFSVLAFLRTLQLFATWKKNHEAFPWNPSGVLELGKRWPTNADSLQKLATLYDDALIRFQDKEQLTRLAGIDMPQAGWFYPNGGWLQPALLCEFLYQEQHEHIHWIGNTSIQSLVKSGNGWQCLDQNHKLVSESNLVILANANGASQLEQSQWLPLQKVRGQISHLLPTLQSRKLLRPLCASTYLVPGGDGNLILGATFEPDSHATSWQGHPSTQLIDTMCQRAPSLANALGEADPSDPGRVSFRSTTLDHLPILGALPDPDFYQQQYADLQRGKPESLYADAQYQNGLMVSLGHGSHGFTTSLLCADILLSLAEGLSPAIPNPLLSAIHPGRFLIRDLLRRSNLAN